MYLNASTDSIEIILGGTVTANQLQWNVSYQDITSSGMTLPQNAGAGLTNNATLVTMVAAPSASTTRQVTNINVYNADTATATVTIRKDVSGTKYVLITYALTTLDTLMWSREDGWRVMSGGGSSSAITALTGDVTATGPGSAAASIANDAVTYAKIQNVSAASRLLGRGSAGGAGDVEEITLGSGLSMTGTSLSATGTSYIFSTGLTNAAGTVTANLSTGVSGGQSVIGGTAASNSLTLSSTSNATKGKILFGTSAYDEVNNRLGIGTASPGGLIEILSESLTVSPVLWSSYYADSQPNAGGFQANKARGSVSSPTALLSDDVIAGFFARGYHSGGAFGNNTAAIRFTANQNFTSTAQGTKVDIATTNNGTTTRSIKLTVFDTGNTVLQNGGTFTDAGFRLDVNGTARFQGNVTLSTKDIITDTTTGTKIATGTTQKLGFWNAAPIAQPTTAVAAATRVGGGGTTLTDTDTFDGYTLAQVVKALRNAGLLA